MDEDQLAYLWLQTPKLMAQVEAIAKTIETPALPVDKTLEIAEFQWNQVSRELRVILRAAGKYIGAHRSFQVIDNLTVVDQDLRTMQETLDRVETSLNGQKKALLGQNPDQMMFPKFLQNNFKLAVGYTGDPKLDWDEPTRTRLREKFKQLSSPNPVSRALAQEVFRELEKLTANQTKFQGHQHDIFLLYTFLRLELAKK